MRRHWDNREADAFRYKGWLGLGDATKKTWQILVCVMAGGVARVGESVRTRGWKKFPKPVRH